MTLMDEHNKRLQEMIEKANKQLNTWPANDTIKSRMRLDEKRRLELIHLVAIEIERAYRRGFHHGVVAHENGVDETNACMWRYSELSGNLCGAPEMVKDGCIMPVRLVSIENFHLRKNAPYLFKILEDL